MTTVSRRNHVRKKDLFLVHVSEDCSLSQQGKKIGPLQFLTERLLAIVGMYPELAITCDQASFKWGEWETNQAT